MHFGDIKNIVVTDINILQSIPFTIPHYVFLSFNYKSHYLFKLWAFYLIKSHLGLIFLNLKQTFDKL